MEALVEWAPRVAAVLTLMIGLVGFFKPRLITDPQDINIGSPKGYSEIRVVLGGLHIGSAVTALVMHNPAIYTALGAAWLTGVLARLWSMVVDKTSLADSAPGIFVDLLIGALFITVCL